MNNKVKISIFNVQSILNKLHSINNYINENKIDILCLNETFLHNNITNLNLLKQYTIIRNDRIGRGGGVAIIINKLIKFRILKIKSTRDYELIAIEIYNNNEKITLLNAYTHPKSKTNFKFIEQVVRLTNNKIICVGDFNATNSIWHCQRTNPRGKALEKIIFENDLFILNNNSPTSKKSNNIIDLVFCSNKILNKCNNFDVDNSMEESDHRPVKFDFTFSFQKVLMPRINWPVIQRNLTEHFKNLNTNLNNNNDLEKAANYFPNIILDIINQETTFVEKKPSSIRLPNSIYLMIKEKKKLQRVYSKFHDPKIKNELNHLNNQIKKYTKSSLNNNWNELCCYLAQHKPSERTFWNIIKDVETGNKPKNPAILPDVKENKTKANIFAQFYSSIFVNNQTFNNKNISNKDLFSYEQESIYNRPISLDEIHLALDKTKKTKSSGPDNLSFKMIAKLPLECLQHLLLIFNYSFLNHYFPNSWKTAKIKVLRKKDNDLNNPANYRPISLINTTSRLLEKIKKHAT